MSNRRRRISGPHSHVVRWLGVIMVAGALCSKATSGAGIGNAPLGHLKTAIRFAAIGDYGLPGPPEQEVAKLVAGWHPDLVLTTGDNAYPMGEAATMDQHIGRYYRGFIGTSYPQLGIRETANRFFPALGNHDWYTAGAKPYMQYFTLPGNERYYTFTRGPVQFFALDSDPHEPDGMTSDSSQGQWLQHHLQGSSACWKVVYFHHPPYTSGTTHGSSEWMRWPFRPWGTDVVLSGHEHQYERLDVEGLLYMVNGAGGSRLYPFGPPLAGSRVRYNDDYGALFVEATHSSMSFQFITRTGKVVDTYRSQKNCEGAPPVPIRTAQ